MVFPGTDTEDLHLREGHRMEKKRLFFGFEIIAPWPELFPPGRVLGSHMRHLTVAFLGNTDWTKLSAALQDIPLPTFKLGLAGKFSAAHFLPHHHPHVVAWKVTWLESDKLLIEYQRQLTLWLTEQGCLPIQPEKKWLPHVTLCRQPFEMAAWKAAFQELPLICHSLHLYESLGNLTYQPIWTHPLSLPFEEIDHTADIAFLLRGHTPKQLYIHAQLALAFTYPPLLPFLQTEGLELQRIQTKDDIVIALSEIIATADGQIGIPFKGISLHGKFTEKNGILEWEMIVDV